jgi:hypothetical protein
MTRMSHRLPPWQQRLLAVSGGALLVSGIAWLAVHYTIGAGAGALPHPAESWLMRVHGLAAFAGLFALGTLATQHVPRGLRLGAVHRHAHQRRTGLVLLTLGGLLVATGYALYYFAPEDVRPALGWVHAALGVAMASVVLGHRRHARAARRAHFATLPRAGLAGKATEPRK